MRHYVILDGHRPDPLDPYSVFRTPAEGGPPMELFDPTTGEWVEEVSLIDYFTGDELGAQEVPPEALSDILDTLVARGVEA